MSYNVQQRSKNIEEKQINNVNVCQLKIEPKKKMEKKFNGISHRNKVKTTFCISIDETL